MPGQLNLYFSKTAFFKCALHSVYSSVVLFFIPYAAMHDTVREDGKDIADYQSFALLAQTCLMLTVGVQVWLEEGERRGRGEEGTRRVGEGERTGRGGDRMRRGRGEEGTGRGGEEERKGQGEEGKRSCCCQS